MPPSRSSKPYEVDRLLSRATGCLLGGAVGDALGAPVEFMSFPEIQRQFGDLGITDYAPCYGRDGGAITDDTQMTLFTAEGLLRAYVRGMQRGMVSISSVVCHAYLRWLLTQGIEPQAANVSKSGWLYRQRRLHSQRAPGSTCVEALKAKQRFSGDRAVNESKGCGGVMRVAPAGIIAHGELEQNGGEVRVFELGCDLAGLTHGHPTGYLTGGALALMVASLMHGDTLRNGVERTLGVLRRYDGGAESVAAISQAVEYAELSPGRREVMERMGEGWVAEEALAMGIYAALSATNFSSGVSLAVNHGGDSDSTGSIAGNLLGVALGIDAIPRRWLRRLELCDVTKKLAGDLVACHSWTEECYETFERYPGG